MWLTDIFENRLKGKLVKKKCNIPNDLLFVGRILCRQHCKYLCLQSLFYSGPLRSLRDSVPNTRHPTVVVFFN